MAELDDFRAQKDAFFARPPPSPPPPPPPGPLPRPRYCPENPALAFDLASEPFEDPEPVEMQTSTGESATYLRWGRLSFAVEGRDVTLTLFADPGSGGFFLPFQDAGRGTETYGAGRYLDVEPLPDGRLHVDFNYAYNPYCAYNDGWSCPITPFEN
nr:DUF1684 domain-containing protein [Tepidiformaceae bacterium]